ncbi:plexin-A4-like [Ptychodera flava]|uniref:plexin-A4-like n=1 Tax=Ptychodera flava TaxID=63121 RepID=UPI003969DE9A
MNIYHNKDLEGYECAMTIENTLITIGATRHDANLVTCNAREYTYQSTRKELNVNLTLRWNNGENIIEDVHGYTVTLYKCNAGRHNCRECLSNSTTTSVLNCGWNECINTCEYVKPCASYCFETDEAKCPSDGSTRTCAFVWSAFVIWYFIIKTIQE